MDDGRTASDLCMRFGFDESPTVAMKMLIIVGSILVMAVCYWAPLEADVLEEYKQGASRVATIFVVLIFTMTTAPSVLPATIIDAGLVVGTGLFVGVLLAAGQIYTDARIRKHYRNKLRAAGRSRSRIFPLP